MEPELVSHRQSFKAHVRNLAVWDADNCSIQSANAGRAQTDTIDFSKSIANLQNISHSYDLIDNEGYPADNIFEGFLGGERHGDAAYSESGQGASGADPEIVQNDQNSREDEHQISH